ncbi:hypothetical protein EPN52_00995 [bacterium]|nr:MAG: hypothetical protein EPN52_00995 [bacterium]
MMLAAISGALVLGSVGWLGAAAGSALVAEIDPLPESPSSSLPPVPWLVAGCAVLGAFIVPHAASMQIGVTALVVFALVAAWCSDVQRGIVPDICTLGPLAAILFVAAIEHRPAAWLSATIVFVPFALTAWLSGGRGMGWGDVKLAALGGAVLGAPIALSAFAVASAVAAVVHWNAGVRGVPIAFAPYLAAAIGIGLAAGTPL